MDDTNAITPAHATGKRAREDASDADAAIHDDRDSKHARVAAAAAATASTMEADVDAFVSAARTGDAATVARLKAGTGITAGHRAEALMLASTMGHDAVIEALLPDGAIVNAPGQAGLTALQCAALQGSVSMCTLLLCNGAKPSMYGYRTCAPLILAIERGFEDVCRLLCDAGADVESRSLPFPDGGACTPLSLACHLHHWGIARLLLSHGADAVHQQTCRAGCTLKPLHHAAAHGNVDVLDALASCGAYVDEVCGGTTPLIVAAGEGHIEFVRMLVTRHGAGINLPGQHSRTALMIAARKGRAAMCKLLLSLGADVNAVDAYAMSAASHAAVAGDVDLCAHICDIMNENLRADVYIAAAEHGRIPIMDMLFTRGHHPDAIACYYAVRTAQSVALQWLMARMPDFGVDDVYARDCDDATLLHAAAEAGHASICTMLLDAGADVDLRTRSLWSAVMLAADNGHVNACEVLVERGAHLSAQDDGGFTALMFAAEHGHVDAARLLIDAGADLEAENHHGDRALHIAAFCNHAPTVLYLASRGANTEARVSRQGEHHRYTPLMRGAGVGSAAACTALIAAGADVNATTGYEDGNATALSIAVADKRWSVCVALLMSWGTVSGLIPANVNAVADMLGVSQMVAEALPDIRVAARARRLQMLWYRRRVVTRCHW